ncbi:MAG: prohibitin family protein [bacterium]|nr:prohibitin family protein [bacterium]
MDDFKMDKKTMTLVKLGIGAFVVLMLLSMINPFVIVGPGERGVVTRLGAVQDTIKQEGLNIRIPVIEKVILVDVRIRKHESKTSAASKDLQIVNAGITLNYGLNPVMVNKLWQEIGPDFENRIIDPAIQETVKAVMARFTAEELIQRRTEVKTQVQEMLETRLKTNYLIVDAVSITDFDFSSEFNAAIEAKQQAEQLALKAQRDLVRIKTEAEQTIAQAQAKAESLRLQKEQVSPQLIELRKIDAQMAAIEKWNGVLPQYTGSGPMPFLSVTSER